MEIGLTLFGRIGFQWRFVLMGLHGCLRIRDSRIQSKIKINFNLISGIDQQKTMRRTAPSRVNSRSRWGGGGNVACGCEIGVPAAFRVRFSMALTSVRPPPNWLISFPVPTITKCSVHSIKTVSLSHSYIRISALASVEHAINQSVARAYKCRELVASGLGGKSQPKRSLASKRTRWC